MSLRHHISKSIFIMTLSPEFAERCRKEALNKYEDEKQKFSIKMMMMGYYKVKSLSSDEGLKKISQIDSKRQSDKGFNERFSEKMWAYTEEVWSQALEQLIIKISKEYGLKEEQDIKYISKVSEEDPKLDFFV
ncbi:Predicted protein family PM-9 [Prochlorococcus marinus subsp. marinus str. CCMP1375]|uniref:Uncharacterized protein n=2 Tax=Prochlorococcaceae TaxID=2881426 RepID=Q7VCQ0_PROMA|nr:Predicted protein family PM-9 [Prochlorococcus marinus subsp. marinus str. CCMP1375]